MLQAVWLASEQLGGKRLTAALAEGLDPFERRGAPRPGALKEKRRRAGAGKSPWASSR